MQCQMFTNKSERQMAEALHWQCLVTVGCCIMNM